MFLFLAALIAGILNSIAGGGSFISFPALLFAGLPAVQANATNTVALWPGLAASSLAYLKRLEVPSRLLIPLLLTSIIGGLAPPVSRSEEHTSELQSRVDLVCRLLLEKKKKTTSF